MHVNCTTFAKAKVCQLDEALSNINVGFHLYDKQESRETAVIRTTLRVLWTKLPATRMTQENFSSHCTLHGS